MYAPRFIRTSRWPSVVLASLLTALSLPSHAVYEYHYSGPLFTMTTQRLPWDPDDPLEGRSFSEQRISAWLYSDAPLSAGATLADVRSISMAWLPGVGAPQQRIDYPFVPEGPIDPAAPPGSPGNPLIWAEINIVAVDANGLPTAWALLISRDVAYLTGRHDYITLSSSNLQDAVDGGYEAFVSYSGQSSGAAGVWQLAVAVPEPQTCLLMLGGIGVIGLSLRKRRGTGVAR
ncbi:MAG TPA: PEP-CTERM sorting domain-containing protein [Roseateles sp.]